jgi:hypothetical protein
MTDWNPIRSMMAAVIDACEQIEAMGCAEEHRHLPVGTRGANVSDTTTSTWTYPENMRYRIVRERHAHGADLPYVPEAARALVTMAQAAAELVGAKEAAPSEAALREMIFWYRDQAVPELRAAIAPTGRQQRADA